MSEGKIKKSKKEIIKDIILLVVAAILIAFVSYWFFGSNCKYIKNGDGYKLIKYFDEKGVTELNIDYVNGDKDKPVNAVSSHAFGNNKYLKTINISDSVKEIDKTTFSGCSSLERIIVDENNTSYCDDEGVLYDKEQTILICYPANRYVYLMDKHGYTEKDEVKSNTSNFWSNVYTYIIPDTVVTIGEESFAGAKIATVIMTYNLKTIEDRAFYKCTFLDEIISNGENSKSNYFLPVSLEYIGAEAFRYCEKLGYIYIPSKVTYIGTCAFRDTGTNVEKDEEYVFINVALSKEEFENKVEAGKKWYRGNGENINYGVGEQN